MSFVKLTRTEKYFKAYVQHYDEERYWKYRERVCNFIGGG